jgi:hypothetical protein
VWDLLRGVQVKSLRLDPHRVDALFYPRTINCISMSEDKIVALMGRELNPQLASAKLCIWDYSTQVNPNVPQEMVDDDSELDIDDFELIEDMPAIAE